jgi:hypothetical protein
MPALVALQRQVILRQRAQQAREAAPRAIVEAECELTSPAATMRSCMARASVGTRMLLSS